MTITARTSPARRRCVQRDSAATFTVTSATAIQATVPAGATTGPIERDDAGGTATSATQLHRQRERADDHELHADERAGGDQRDDQRHELHRRDGGDVQRDERATFTVKSATAIQATVPAGATTGPMSVTTPGGTATSATNFTVTASAPTITSFAPTSGPAGTSVTISGTNFTGATAVAFNGTRRELHGDVSHGDSGDGAGGRDDGADQRDDARRHGDQRDQLHGDCERADDHELHAGERAGRRRA